MSVTLLETIRVSDGEYVTPSIHLARMYASSFELTGTPAKSFFLPEVPESMRAGTVKCRILYRDKIESVQFEPYKPAKADSLRIVEAPTGIDYHLKYADRGVLTSLRNLRKEASDVIITVDNLITDTSYSNLLLIAADAIYTPARPLLAGTMRKKLLMRGDIRPIDITPEELLAGKYGIHSVELINAMLPPGAVPPVPVTRISL